MPREAPSPSLWLHCHDLGQVTEGIWREVAFRGENPEHFRSIPSSGKELPHLPAALPSPAHSSRSLHAWEGRSEPFHGVLMLLLPFHYKIVPCHGACGLSPAATQPATSCSLGGDPSKALFRARRGGKCLFLQRKGYFGATGESEPASLPHSLTILAPRRTHARTAAPSPLPPPAGGTAGHGACWGPMCDPTTTALGAHGACPQHHSMGSNFSTRGHQCAGH